MARSPPTESKMKNTEVMHMAGASCLNSRKRYNIPNIIKTSNLRTKSHNNKKSVKLNN